MVVAVVLLIAIGTSAFAVVLNNQTNTETQQPTEQTDIQQLTEEVVNTSVWSLNTKVGSCTYTNSDITMQNSVQYETLSLSRTVENKTSSLIISFKVNPVILGTFEVALSPKPLVGGETYNIAFGITSKEGENKGFQTCYLNKSTWYWETFSLPEANTWYDVSIYINKEPFYSVYTVFKDGELLGSQTVQLYNPTFDELNYITLESWTSTSYYLVKDFTVLTP